MLNQEFKILNYMYSFKDEEFEIQNIFEIPSWIIGHELFEFIYK